jgi:hypothetical protein
MLNRPRRPNRPTLTPTHQRNSVQIIRRRRRRSNCACGAEEKDGEEKAEHYE